MDFQTPIVLVIVALAAGTLVWRQVRALVPTKKVQPAGPAGCGRCPSSRSCSKISCG